MVALRAPGFVHDALTALATALEDVEFGVDSAHLASERDRLAGTIRSYLIPRAIDTDQPVVVVVAGPTGSGKSTLINSVSGLDVSTTGAVRPTTRSPVVLAPAHLADRYLSIGGVECDVVTGRARVLDSLVLVDAPDLDSTETGHRVIAETLIDHADVVVFVTSALRYADEVPWQVLRRAVSRGTPIIHVLNRVSSAASGAVVDFRSRLAAAGLDDDLVLVNEHHLADGAQRVPPVAVRSLKNRLDTLVTHRDAVTREVFDRVLRSTLVQTRDLADAMVTTADEIADLEAKLSIGLSERAAGLDLTEFTDRLSPPDPSQGRGALRRWMKRVGPSEDEGVEEMASALVGPIEGLVHSDIRRWLVEEKELVQSWHLDPAVIIAGSRVAARSHLERWVSFAARIVADDQDVLFERARRELVTRLGLIYEHVGVLVAQRVRELVGALDTDDLRISLGAVTALTAVDA